MRQKCKLALSVLTIVCSLLLLYSCGGGGGGTGGTASGSGSSTNSPTPSPSITNLYQYHLNSGNQDNNECMTACHTDVAEETGAHSTHVQKVSLKCVDCHKKTDLLEGSGGNLRREVEVSLCAGCHSTGTLKWYMQQGESIQNSRVKK